jgi:acetoacetate decarboxylase
VKTVYYLGENLDLTGLQVAGTYTDASKRILPVAMANISGFNNLDEGEQTIVITINGKKATFTVTVKVPPAQ